MLNHLCWRLLGIALLAGLSGCGAVQSLPIKDNNSASYAVRASWHGRSGELNERSGPGVEVGYEGFRARDTQTLAAGQSLILEGGTVFGPETLRHDARLQLGYVAYKHLLRFGSSFQLEPFAGATRVRLKITSQTSGGNSLQVLNDQRTGLIGGVTPRWRFNDWLAIEARMTYFNASAWAHGQSYEAAVVLSPSPNVSLRLGYSERKHDIDPVVSGLESEVNIRARGPLATLQFDF